MSDKTERQEIDAFPALNSFGVQLDWFAAKLGYRSREECILLAGRAALRALPMLHSMLDDFPDQKAQNALTDTIFPLLRCSVVTVIASLSSARDEDLYRSAAMTAVADAAAPDSAAELSIYHAAISAGIEQSINADAAAYAAQAAVYAAASFGVGASSRFATAFIYDLGLLNDLPLRVVAWEPLWPSIGLENARWEHEFRLGTWRRTDPDFFLREWAAFSTILREAGDDWDVWADWFDGVYQGRKGAVYLFDLPELRALKLWQDVALIDDTTWKAGPVVLNAEFKRLVAVAKKEVEASKNKPESASQVPQLPQQQPAALNPVWEDGRLILLDGAASHDSSDALVVAALQTWKHDFQSLVADARQWNISEDVVDFLQGLANRVPDHIPTEFELHSIAPYHEMLTAYRSVVREQWPDLLAARYVALEMQFGRTVTQFSSWKKFTRAAADGKLTRSQIGEISKAVPIIAEAIRNQDPGIYIAAEIPDRLDKLADPLGKEHPGISYKELEKGYDLIAQDVLASLSNVLNRMAEAALGLVKWSKETARQMMECFAENARKALVKVAGATGKAVVLFPVGHNLIGWLVTTFPNHFGWLELVFKFLKIPLS